MSEKKPQVNNDKPVVKRIGTGLPGPGRPKKADELKVQRQALSALKKKYGTVQAAFISLLDSKEPSLIKLVFEYSFGKPADKIETVNGIPFNQLNIQVIATHKQDNNGTETNGFKDNDSIPAP